MNQVATVFIVILFIFAPNASSLNSATLTAEVDTKDVISWSSGVGVQLTSREFYYHLHC